MEARAVDPAHVGTCTVGDIAVRHEVEGAAADRVPLLPLLGGQDLGRAVLGSNAYASSLDDSS